MRWNTLFLMLAMGACLGSSLDAVEVRPSLENKVTQALETKFTAEFIDKPLEDVITELCQIAKVPHRVDLAALQDEGVDPQSPITMKWKNARVAVALRDVLTLVQLRYNPMPEWLTVTTIAKSEEQLDTRVYDVSQLVALMKPRLVPEDGNRQTQFAGGHAQFGGGLGGNAHGASHPVGLRTEPSAETFVAETHLMAAIQEASRGQWEQIDGVGGTMLPGDGRLTIRQTQFFHGEIFRLLVGLESMLSAPNPPPQWLVDVTPEDQQRREKLDQLLDVVVNDGATTISLENWLDLDLSDEGLEFIIDHTGLQDEGVDWNTATITMTPGVTRRTLLTAALQSLLLTAVYDSGRFLITTQAKADELLTRVIYDVSQIPEAHDPAWITNFVQQTTSGQWEVDDGVGGTVSTLGITGLISVCHLQRVHDEIEASLKSLRRPDVQLKPAAPELTTYLYPIPDAQSLMDLQRLLPKLVDVPEATWPEGSVEKLGSALIIRQTAEVHRRIDTLVQAIHQADKVNKTATTPSSPVTKAVTTQP